MSCVRQQDLPFRMMAVFVAAMAVLSVTWSAIPAHAQTYKVLYVNPGGTGVANPAAQAIAQGRDGNLYTTSPEGGTEFATFFKFTPSGTVTVENGTTTFCCSPLSGVTLGTDGNFYGTNQYGPYQGSECGFVGCGQIFKITPAGVETVLYNFTNTANDGYDPVSAPIEATNGKFYGTTWSSAGTDISVAYSITSTGTFSTVHIFTLPEGDQVYAGLVQGSDGNLYGVASGAGANGYGTIFKMTTAGTVTVLHSFDNSDGVHPYYPLIQASDGNFYGTTPAGGTYGVGVVFKITPSGTFTVLHDFQPNTDDGNGPSSSLTQATDGNLYGVTSLGGGTANDGTIYRITTGGTLTILYSFCSETGCADGRDPDTPLKQNTNGLLYGATYYGGNNSSFGDGVIYSLNMGLKPFVNLVRPSGEVGAKVEILGQKLKGTTGVSFNGTAATFTIVSNTYLTAIVPAGATTGPVQVTTSSATLNSNQTFRVTPQLKSFNPTSGPVGTPVTITGVSLTQTKKVTFGGVKATSVQINSDTQVTANVPTGAKTGKIAITTPGGSATSSGIFTVTQ